MKKSKKLNRREFIRNSALVIAGVELVSSGSPLIANGNSTSPRVKGYRKLGRTGFKASDIGLGGVTNVEIIKAMLNAGVNYIDTAEGYSRGKSEISMGQAIKGRDRKSVFITTKLHIKENETKESILNRAYKCLERLDTDYIDCLMTHGAPNVEMVKYAPFHTACEQLKKEGKIRFVGISNHGVRVGTSREPMDKVLLAAAHDGRFSVMLMVYNFIQREKAEKVIEVCKKKNIGVSLMKTNPVGRYLSMKERIDSMEKREGQNPERLKRMKASFNRVKETAKRGDWFTKKYNLNDPAEIRIASTRFGLSNPGVTTVLARTQTFEDVGQFLQASGITLSDMEAKKLAAFSRGPGKLYCRHACGLCESSCPHNVPVNTIMRYNHYFEAQGLEKHAMEKYSLLKTTKASQCEICAGICEKNCPYGVPIQGLLNIAHQNLTLMG